MSPEVWTVLITAIFSIVKECKAANQPPEEIRDQFRNPRGLALLKIERAAREANGMTRREWRKDDARRSAIMAEIDAERRKMTDADIDELIGEAE